MKVDTNTATLTARYTHTCASCGQQQVYICALPPGWLSQRQRDGTYVKLCERCSRGMKRKDPRGRRQGEFRYSDVAAIKILEFLKNKQYSTWLDIARLLNNRGCYGSIKCLLKAGRIQRFALGRYRITDKGREALERLTAKEKRA